jgi:hypothetical protein
MRQSTVSLSLRRVTEAGCTCTRCQAGLFWRALLPPLYLPGALGKLGLKGALKNLLQPYGDGASMELAKYRDIGRHMHGLRIDLHRDVV